MRPGSSCPIAWATRSMALASLYGSNETTQPEIGTTGPTIPMDRVRCATVPDAL